jgi:AAA+ superfamily predicted ATPase
MCQLHAANNVVDSLLSQLDHVIQNRPVYIEQKEKKLNDLRQALRQRISDENRFTLLGEYLDEYRSYNTDLSLYISRERYQVALRMKNKEHQDNALMNTAEIMGTAGMYKEAVDLMHNVQINHLRMTCTRIITIFTAPSMASWPITPLRNRRKNSMPR